MPPINDPEILFRPPIKLKAIRPDREEEHQPKPYCHLYLTTVYKGCNHGVLKRYSGSLIGGIAETQEMLDYCAAHNIVSDVEVIDIKDINDAYERMLKGDVRYRFVIDMATI